MYKKMLEIHDRIKENPFRLDFETNLRYYKGYFDLLYELEDMFYKICKEAKKNNTNSQLAGIPLDFFHDFRYIMISSRTSAYHLDEDDYERYLAMGINKEKQSDRENIIELSRLIELNLTAIHSFIETGEFNSCYLYTRSYKLEWDDKLQKWTRID